MALKIKGSGGSSLITYYLLTEAGNPLIAEDGNFIVYE
jgi:hypothetical protein